MTNRNERLAREHAAFLAYDNGADFARLMALLDAEDSTYGNDIAPSMRAGFGIQVFVDYAEPRAREIGPAIGEADNGAFMVLLPTEYDPAEGWNATGDVYCEFRTVEEVAEFVDALTGAMQGAV